MAGPQELLTPGAGLVLEQAQLCGEVVHQFVRAAASGAAGPSCACWSEFHSSYQRSIADLPSRIARLSSICTFGGFDAVNQRASVTVS